DDAVIRSTVSYARGGVPLVQVWREGGGLTVRSRLVSAALVTLFILPVASARAAVVRVPAVTGPLPVSAAAHPFGGAQRQWVAEDLSKDGYVEEEYFVSGLANVYNWPAPGPATIRTADAPYTTRILVRRPADPARSSGNAVVEMLNPSNNVDINI